VTIPAVDTGIPSHVARDGRSRSYSAAQATLATGFAVRRRRRLAVSNHTTAATANVRPHSIRLRCHHTAAGQQWSTIMSPAAGLTSEQVVFLHAHRVGHLATVDEHGRPHNVPVCFAAHNGRLYIAIDEKPKRGAPGDLRRVRNVRANPAVCLVVDDYDEDWSRLAWMQVRGEAALVEDPGERSEALAALRERYPQYRAMALEGRPLLRIIPLQVIGWRAMSTG